MFYHTDHFLLEMQQITSATKCKIFRNLSAVNALYLIRKHFKRYFFGYFFSVLTIAAPPSPIWASERECPNKNKLPMCSIDFSKQNPKMGRSKHTQFPSFDHTTA